MSYPIYELTDGTTTLSFIRRRNGGYQMEPHKLKIPELKEAGVWQDSPLGQGRRLAYRQRGNAAEEIPLSITGSGQDNAIHLWQALVRLLEKAMDYWTTEWQDEPVYIVAKAACESNTRYALVYAGQIPEMGYLYSMPFLSLTRESVLAEMTLQLERGVWLENAPGTGTAVAISAVEAYNSINLGNVDSAGARQARTDWGVYVANKRNTANVTHIYRWDNSISTWDMTNLMTADLPYRMFTHPTGDHDATYFGCRTSLDNSGPFCSLVFDLDPDNLIVGVNDVTWEYWNGTTWIQLPAVSTQDNTNADGAMTGVAFDTGNIRSVHWLQPSDWAPNNPAPKGVALGITGYWVRAVPHVYGSIGGSSPIQWNRDIYSVVWPYVDILEGQVSGDIPALAKMHTWYQAIQEGATSGSCLFTSLMCGLRSYDRGAKFTAYLNCANEQNPTDVLLVVGGAFCTLQDWVCSPTGRAVRHSGAGADTFTFTLTNTISEHFRGKFHVFLRLYQDGGAAGDLGVDLAVGPAADVPAWSPGYMWESGRVYTTRTGFQTLDFGLVDIPGSTIPAGQTLGQFNLQFTSYLAGAGIVYYYDIVLLPVDEWAGEMGTMDAGKSYSDRSIREAFDAIGVQKRGSTAYVETATTPPYLLTNHLKAQNGPSILQTDKRQRLWFFGLEYVSAGVTNGGVEGVHSLQVQRVNRWLALRGND